MEIKKPRAAPQGFGSRSCIGPHAAALRYFSAVNFLLALCAVHRPGLEAAHPGSGRDFAGRGPKFFVRSGSRTLRGLGGKRRVFHAPFLALELPGRAVQRRSTPLWRAVGCALVESRACIDRSSNRPIRSALACRSGRFRRRAGTSCARSASLNRVAHRWCLRR